MNKTETPIHFPEVESIFPVMFGSLTHGKPNAVWCLALEGDILQNYENNSNNLRKVVPLESDLQTIRHGRFSQVTSKNGVPHLMTLIRGGSVAQWLGHLP